MSNNYKTIYVLTQYLLLCTVQQQSRADTCDKGQSSWELQILAAVIRSDEVTMDVINEGNLSTGNDVPVYAPCILWIMSPCGFYCCILFEALLDPRPNVYDAIDEKVIIPKSK